MARQRSHAAPLAHLLDGAARPIYVLDDELTIVFCNRALRDMLGEAADEVVGRQCHYHSPPEPESPEALTAGLCPPPTVLEGRQMTGCISWPTAAGSSIRRGATFIPLANPSGDVIAVIALVDATGAAEPVLSPSPPADGESLELHEQIRAIRRQTAIRYSIERLVGISPAIRRARAQAELAAASRASVLLVGAPGSGRQHVATAIHCGSRLETAGVLVPLSCSLLGPELLHSTLMALVSGQPLADQPGHNTLLLNDVDRLPAENQAEMAKLFSARTFPLRLMATSERPLTELARHGQFREDLAAVLSTIIIDLPPLAERREDLPLLAQAMLEELNGRGGKQVTGLAAEALDRLDAYHWPGNVDELAQVLAETHQRAAGREISTADLPKRLHLAADAAAHPRRSEEKIVLDEFLAQIERELIRRAVARARGNKAKAARLLGITRPRLGRRMVQLGLEKELP